MKILKILILLLLHSHLIMGQITGVDRFEQLEDELTAYALEYPKINRLIDISITGSIQEFALAFSKETKLNLTIDPSIEQKIVSNFAETKSTDILLHLCKFYNLDLTFSGTIISLIPYKEEPKKSPAAKPIDISYNAFNDQIELTLKNDTLDMVLQKISELSTKNVIATKAASQILISGFIGSTNLENALEQIAKRNDLQTSMDENGYYLFDILNKSGPKAPTKKERAVKEKNSKTAKVLNKFETNVGKGPSGENTISLNVTKAKLSDLIKEVSDKMNANYFLITEPDEEVSMILQDASYESFLQKSLAGSKYGFQFADNIYTIGEKESEGLQQTKVHQLQYRSVEAISEFIPAEVGSGVEIKELIGLNSVIMNGQSAEIDELVAFFNSIDKAIPVVMIELLIVDVQENRETRIGLTAGVGEAPATTGGSIFPGVNFSFGANAINDLLSLLSGNGIVNLGQVTPNFYASLQAVEDQGHVFVRSKPRLSTLNGEEATLSIGETRYYLDQRTTLQGNQSPISIQDRNYRPVNADFSITILPVVSGNEHVTLKIDVNQSDFIGQVQNDAPPAQVNRTFNSNIRIRNGEMIVLGGLESKSLEDSGTGIPILGRIPVIKWFFSSRRKNKSKSKLLLFVKPTIMY